MVYNYQLPTYGKVDSWGLVLDDDIVVAFQMLFTDDIQADGDAYVEVSVAAQIKCIPVSQAVNGIRVKVAAAQMAEKITLCVVAGDGTQGEKYSYTVKEYADYLLADSSYYAYHTLVKEMLNYGAMAQLYFDYDAENLVNEGITGVATQEVPESTEELAISDNATGVSFCGASLVYRDKIAVRCYFRISDNIAGCTFTANGNTYTPCLKDGLYYVELADILPQNLDQQITVTVTDAQGGILTVSYSPMNYIVRMHQKGGETAKNLLKALYNYHLAAKNLRTAV